ncbi:MAG: SsrA-binding protein SmpB [Planctomycetes bacterium]|nr:SsrA-binding protein SmpB [Planctomycetota bacterium]
MAQKQEKNLGGPVIQNKKAYFNFELVEKVEAGMLLVGTEVKSLRNKQCELDGAYARMTDKECWLVGCKIAQYEQAADFANHDPMRKRKLLLHKAQLKKIRTKLDQRGFTLVPLRIYFNSRGLAKCELALARGKRQYDKRQKIQDKDQKRDLRRMKKFR